MCGDYNLVILKVLMNKNAFQWNVYRPLVDHIPAWAGGYVSQHALGRGVYPSKHWAGVSAQGGVCLGGVCLGVSAQGVSAWWVCPGGCLPGGCLSKGCLPRGCLPGGCLPREGVCLGGLPRGCGRHPPPRTKGRHPYHGQTDDCENITFAHFVCRR